MAAYNTRKTTPAARQTTIARRQARAVKQGTSVNLNRAGHARRTR